MGNRSALRSLARLHQTLCYLGGFSRFISLQDRDSPEVQSRLGSIDRRYQELLELAKIRKQRLLDALALYKLYNEADGVEQWITEKEKLLHTMIATDDVEEVEILKARFDTFDQEMNANADKVETVQQLSRQLVHNEHPNSDEVLGKENELKEKSVPPAFLSHGLTIWKLIGFVSAAGGTSCASWLTPRRVV